MGMRLFCRVLGSAAVLGAMASLFLPMALQFVDRSGHRITCGPAIHAVLDQATAEDAANEELYLTRGTGFAASDYADQCESYLNLRCKVALQVASVGVVIGLVTLYRPPRRQLVSLSDPRSRRGSSDRALIGDVESRDDFRRADPYDQFAGHTIAAPVILGAVGTHVAGGDPSRGVQ